MITVSKYARKCKELFRECWKRVKEILEGSLEEKELPLG